MQAQEHTLENEKIPGEVLDPVCGMTILQEDAAGTVKHKGQDYNFCSKGCVAKFEADPERHLSPAEPPPVPKAVAAPEYICPVDPEVHQSGPGACPKYGMALEAAVIIAPAIRTDFTCPMHPQISRPGPGNYPICGMTLEPRESAAEEANPELVHMTRRFWTSVALAVPLLSLMVSEMLPTMPLQHLFSARTWAGVLFPVFGLLLNPMIAAAAMSCSSVSVIANSLRLRAAKL